MKTINDILKPSDYYVLGDWSIWLNDVMRRLDKVSITLKPRIEVQYTASEYHSSNGYEWDCDHASAALDYVTVNYDDSELVLVCDSCEAQLVGENWINE